MTLKTEVIVITDRSGSMSAIQKEVIGGYNNFLAELKKEPGECRVTYTQFDDQYEVVYQGKNLNEVPDLTEVTFEPRGMTALNDAICRTLNEQGKRIHDEKWAELVIVQIITDGGENSSREFTVDQAKAMTEHAQKNGWKIMFLAANQDAFATGAAYGFSTSTTANFAYTAKGASAAYTATAVAANSLRGARSVGTLESLVNPTK